MVPLRHWGCFSIILAGLPSQKQICESRHLERGSFHSFIQNSPVLNSALSPDLKEAAARLPSTLSPCVGNGQLLVLLQQITMLHLLSPYYVPGSVLAAFSFPHFNLGKSSIVGDISILIFTEEEIKAQGSHKTCSSHVTGLGWKPSQSDSKPRLFPPHQPACWLRQEASGLNMAAGLPDLSLASSFPPLMSPFHGLLGISSLCWHVFCSARTQEKDQR